MEVDKVNIQNVLDSFGDKVEIEDLMYKLYVIKGIQQGLEDIRNNRVISHKEVKRRLGVK